MKILSTGKGVAIVIYKQDIQSYYEIQNSIKEANAKRRYGTIIYAYKLIYTQGAVVDDG